jgi:hypothetical protein
MLAAALWVAALAGCSNSDQAQAAPHADKATAEDKLPTMTVDEVEHALAAKEAVAVDCNGQTLRKRAGVVPGAILVSDYERLSAGELPADKQMKLVFYCASPG